MSIHSPRTAYDFTTAIINLSSKIQELSSIRQQQQGGPGILSAGLRYWRQNKSSLLFIFTMYSMSTAAVLAAMFSESRLQSDQLLEGHEQQHLQQQIERLQQQAQRQQQMLDSLKVEVQQYRGSWWGPGRFRQQLLDKVQRLRAQEAAVEAAVESAVSQQPQREDSNPPRADEEFGVRVGKFGKGFII